MRELADRKELYDIYRVAIKFEDKLLGGVPRNEKLIKNWLEARGITDRTNETVSEVDLTEAEDWAWSGFKVDEQRGHYIETRQIKAMIKENAKVLGITRTERGSKQILQHALFVFPDEDENPERPWDQDRIYLGTDPNIPLSSIDTCGHITGPQGPRNILKRNDYVERPLLKFRVCILKGQTKFTKKALAKTLSLAQDGGLGASRSQGYGRFKVVELTKLD